MGNNMKKILLFLFCILLLPSIVHATATGETGDKNARPAVLYGKTADGKTKPILVDSNGVIQTGG